MIEQIIRDSLERVSEFFRSQGIIIDHEPTFIYVDGYSNVSKIIAAQVPGELEQIRYISERGGKERYLKHIPTWYQSKGISLSDAALVQSFEILLPRLRKLNGLTDEAIKGLKSYNREIIFFKTVEDFLAANPKEKEEIIIDSIVSHELWHVIEARKGLLDSIIIEGTAEYSRTEYEKWRKQQLERKDQSDTESKLPDLSDSQEGKTVLINFMAEHIYKKGLEIVKETVSSLPEMLIHETRIRMGKDLLDYLDILAEERVAQNYTSSQEMIILERMLFPEFNILDQKLTKENILVAINSLGMTKMAVELRHQDCSKILDYYEKIGYTGTRM